MKRKPKVISGSTPTVSVGQWAEAKASVSLDGCTQSCEACQGEYVTVRMDGKRMDEIVGYGRFHLEDNGGSWFLDLGGRMMSLTSKKATPIDGDFHEGTVAAPLRGHTCGRREITAAEAELVEAALEKAWDVTGSSMIALRLGNACRAVRAEREKGKR